MTRGRIWLAWLVANIAPSLLVSAVIVALRQTLGVNQLAVIAYVLLFASVAWLQARVWVRWRTQRAGGPKPRAVRWASWTIAGLVAAMFFGVGALATLDGLGNEKLGLFVGWVAAGLVLGVVQAAVLGVSRLHAALWVAACVSGWGAAAAFYSHLSGSQLGDVPVFRWLVGGLLLEGNVELAITAFTFALYGISTGAVLSRLTPKT